MKRKLYVLIAAGLLPVLALAFGYKVWAGNPLHPQDPPTGAIGFLDSSGSPQPMLSHLVPTLKTGESITSFEFQYYSGGLRLVRRATTSAGYVAEFIPVDLGTYWIIAKEAVTIVCCYQNCSTCNLDDGSGNCSCTTNSCTIVPNPPTLLRSDIWQ